MIPRFLPLAGVLATLVVAFGWRPWLQRRRYGAYGILLFRASGPAQHLRDAFAVALFALLLAQSLVAALAPESLLLAQADRRAPAGLRLGLGALLMLTGLVLLVTAQLELGASWRIGIDEAAKPGLVTSGLYGRSRNPIFLALLIIVAGYTLLIPTLLSLALLAGAYVGTRLQIAAEEAYLSRTYGAQYRTYAQRVGRLVPGIGKWNGQ
ncbi:MAG: isoprenylcysteine carboxylmethyltransferase family protein [Betaproteobacteria bacterium]|nr:MAG: isoprenylcysteine carboxylmethyltransferase family protein [Betaproteobacteria bacterium]